MTEAPPVGALSREKVLRMSTRLVETEPRIARRSAPGVCTTVPWVPLTAKLAGADAVQAPPVGAVPHPPVVVRLKASWASSVGGGVLATVMDRVVELVAPSSSRTVRPTVY